jgi:hypothetical protein
MYTIYISTCPVKVSEFEGTRVPYVRDWLHRTCLCLENRATAQGGLRVHMAQSCSFVLQGLGLTVAQVQINIASELLSTFVSKRP